MWHCPFKLNVKNAQSCNPSIWGQGQSGCTIAHGLSAKDRGTKYPINTSSSGVWPLEGCGFKTRRGLIQGVPTIVLTLVDLTAEWLYSRVEWYSTFCNFFSPIPKNRQIWLHLHARESFQLKIHSDLKLNILFWKFTPTFLIHQRTIDKNKIRNLNLFSILLFHQNGQIWHGCRLGWSVEIFFDRTEQVN